MKLSIAHLRAAGLTDTQILKVVEEAQAEQREKERKRQRNHRARHARPRDKRDNQIPQQDQQSCHARPRDKRDKRDNQIPQQDQQSCHGDNPPQYITSPPKEKEEKSKNSSPPSMRATSIAPDWQLTDADWRYAHGKGWNDRRIAEEAERFKLHFQSSGMRKVNWHATWCKWVTSPYQQSQPGNGQQLSYRDKRQQELEDVKAALDASIARARHARESGEPDPETDGLLFFPQRA